MDRRRHLEASARSAAGWYPAGPNRVVARMLGDTKIVLDTRDFSLTPHLVMDGFWESWITVWFLQNVSGGSPASPSSRLLNIGANCGYYALAAARRGAQVVAVEPQQPLVENLRLSASLNGVSMRVEQCVAGDRHRRVNLQLHPHLGGSAFVGKPVDGFCTQLEVDERPAADLMPDATCAFIDAEGYEPQIWSGLKPLLDKGQLDWVAMEWSPSRYENAGAFLDSLKAYGSLRLVGEDSREHAVSADTLLSGVSWDTLVVRRDSSRMTF